MTDPTLQPVELTLGGTIYTLIFTFGALAQAQAKLRKLGVTVNLLHAIDLSNLTPDQIAPLLFSAIITHQPAADYRAIEAAINFRTLPAIMTSIVEAYSASMAEPEAEQAPVPLDQPAQS